MKERGEQQGIWLYHGKHVEHKLMPTQPKSRGVHGKGGGLRTATTLQVMAKLPHAVLLATTQALQLPDVSTEENMKLLPTMSTVLLHPWLDHV